MYTTIHTYVSLIVCMRNAYKILVGNLKNRQQSEAPTCVGERNEE